MVCALPGLLRPAQGAVAAHRRQQQEDGRRAEHGGARGGEAVGTGLLRETLQQPGRAAERKQQPQQVAAGIETLARMHAALGAARMTPA